jgi:hypothetical protein
MDVVADPARCPEVVAVPGALDKLAALIKRPRGVDPSNI